MDYQYLQYEIEDYIATVTIDRPPVNALNQALVGELKNVAGDIENAADAGKVRCAIITSTGKYFCAGADLKERMGIAEADVAPTVQKIGEAVARLADISVPTIAAIQGSAMGGGFEVALAADIRVMAEGAQVGLRETALAIIPGAGGTQRLTRLIGPSNAILWITSAGLFSAREALQQGAVNYVVPASELMTKARSIAQQIAQNGPLAVLQAKCAIKQGMDLPLPEGLALEFECYKKIIATKDRVEGLNAFREKRPPEYSGQ